MEIEPKAWLRVVDLVARDLHRYSVIDASGSIEEVADLVWASIPDQWR